MENTYWFRWFLICSALANKVLALQPLNFAKLIIEEEKGAWGNEQMTRHFHRINESLSEIMANDDDILWEELDIEEVAKLSVEEIQKYHEEYCIGRMSISELE